MMVVSNLCVNFDENGPDLKCKNYHEFILTLNILEHSSPNIQKVCLHWSEYTPVVYIEFAFDFTIYLTISNHFP